MDQKGIELGYFIINSANGYVAQLEAENDAYPNLLDGIRQLCSEIKINNVDPGRRSLIQALESSGLENHIDQYEMEMYI